jgi:hypothetical protein
MTKRSGATPQRDGSKYRRYQNHPSENRVPRVCFEESRAEQHYSHARDHHYYRSARQAKRPTWPCSITQTRTSRSLGPCQCRDLGTSVYSVLVFSCQIVLLFLRHSVEDNSTCSEVSHMPIHGSLWECEFFPRLPLRGVRGLSHDLDNLSSCDESGPFLDPSLPGPQILP